MAIPNGFTGGTTAVAAEVHANFQAVAVAINDNDTRLDAWESGVANGVVKAAVPIDDTGVVTRYFNLHGGAPAVTIRGTGQRVVAFPGFTDLNMRFFGAKVGNEASFAPLGTVMTTPSNASPTDSVFVQTLNPAGVSSDLAFYLIIF